MNKPRENYTLMFSQPFIQNEIENYYIKQAEGQHGGLISDSYENQARTGAGFYSGVQYQKGYDVAGLRLHSGVSFYQF